MPKPPTASTHIVSTTQIDLAAALTALGCPPHEHGLVLPVDHGEGTVTRFTFDAKGSACGLSVQEIMQVWRDDAWFEANPEHPLAYLKAAADNRLTLLKAVKEAQPFVVVRWQGKQHVVRRESAAYRELIARGGFEQKGGLQVRGGER